MTQGEEIVGIAQKKLSDLQPLGRRQQLRHPTDHINLRKEIWLSFLCEIRNVRSTANPWESWRAIATLRGEHMRGEDQR